MAIIETITDSYHFWDWLKNSDNYSSNFSFEGSKALQEYLDNLSDELGENIEFDPIAWCCEYSEYDSLADAYKELRYDYTYVEGEAREYFEDNTTIIEVDGSSHIILQDF